MGVRPFYKRFEQTGIVTAMVSYPIGELVAER